MEFFNVDAFKLNLKNAFQEMWNQLQATTILKMMEVSLAELSSILPFTVGLPELKSLILGFIFGLITGKIFMSRLLQIAVVAVTAIGVTGAFVDPASYQFIIDQASSQAWDQFWIYFQTLTPWYGTGFVAGFAMAFK